MPMHSKDPSIHLLKRGRVPDRFIPGLSDRHIWRAYGMWGIVDMEWTGRLADFIGERKSLEVMAGRGWLSHALRQHGKEVVSTGRLSGSYDTHTAPGTVTDVIELDAVSAVMLYEAEVDVLIVSWPVADMAMYHALQYWGEGKPVVFVGEWYSEVAWTLSGCACDEFFLSVVRDETIDLGYPEHNQGIDIATVCYRK